MANKYLHLFKNQSEFETAYNGQNYEEPWVSLINTTGAVHYNKIENDSEELEDS